MDEVKLSRSEQTDSVGKRCSVTMLPWTVASRDIPENIGVKHACHHEEILVLFSAEPKPEG
jgi:hypothetical protein